MPTSADLIRTVHDGWFMGYAWMDVALIPDGPTTRIEYTDIERVGGPRDYTKCWSCSAMEWYSRITQKSQFQKHACTDPAQNTPTLLRCQQVMALEWRHRLRNYNFTLGLTPELPGMKCLFVIPEPAKLIRHGAVCGFMMWRKRLAKFQTVFCTAAQVPAQDLSKFDFLLMPINGLTPVIPQHQVKPKIILYGHDHHHPLIMQRVPQLLAAKPAALITPYPTIWQAEFKIPPETKVIFAPYLTDPMWSAMNTNFANRSRDVLIVGTSGHAYPERQQILELFKKKPQLPFRYTLWAAPEPPDLDENHSAKEYGTPVLAYWSSFLATSKICVFGQDKWGYLVSKYSEIMGATSLMVAPHIPDCDHLGIKRSIHYVPLARPVQTELIKQLTVLVQEYSKYQPMALAGLEWFRQYADKILYERFWRDIRFIVKGY